MEFTTTPEAKMTRMKPTTQGTWNRIASKHYRHESGVEVRYNHKAWNWEVVGGANDSLCWTTLSHAQHFATMPKPLGK